MSKDLLEISSGASDVLSLEEKLTPQKGQVMGAWHIHYHDQSSYGVQSFGEADYFVHFCIGHQEEKSKLSHSQNRRALNVFVLIRDEASGR